MAGLPPITQLAGNHRALFEGYWSLLDQAGSGKVPASIAAAFLKKSQLREPTLHKIWNLSDPTSTGSLDKQGFFMALRLIASCQAGKEPHIGNIALTDPPPRFTGVDPTTLGGRGKWSVDKEEQTRYEQLFQSLKPSGGLLSGDKARPFMLTSKLPLDVLGKVWSLSDIDKDGSLDKEEFAVAMKLIALAQGGETLPPTLPVSLVPPSKTKQGGVASSLTTTSLGGTQSPRPSSSPIPGSPIPGKKTMATSPSPEWIITSEVKAKYDSYFQGIDKDQDGFVSGEETRGLFMASNLPHALLAHVWNLCDIEKKGRLNSDLFALAMFLIAEKVRGKEIPTELTPAMIPPSLRKQTTPPTTTPTHSAVDTSAGWSTPEPNWTTPSSLGTGLNVTMATSAANTSTAWSTPTTSAEGGSEKMETDDFGGFGSDFSAIKELDTVSKDVDSIRKEKAQLSEEIKTKQELVQQRKAEVEAIQGQMDSSTRQRDALERERQEAQSKLDELDHEKARVDGEIAELKQNCEEEQREIDRLKHSLTEQETSKQAQSEELDKLKLQLETLKREESEYKQRVEAGAAELDRVQRAHQNIQNQISQTRQNIDSYKEEHHGLTSTLTMFPPISTPSSTPSSSVININDMGLSQLSSELTVPHVEPDAISARATAGSSSPVSSISGFSTNSHLDDGVDDTTVGGGAKNYDKSQSDPFSFNQSNDPFAAFSLPSSDPFASSPGGQTNSGGMGAGFSGKPSVLSAFDPFGASDPFKSVTSMPSVSSGEDLFKGDPFGSSSLGGTSQNVPPSSGSGTTDPFSGQDPFSSDLFASTTKDIDQATGWGSSNAFPIDPFASQSASSDLTSDPFSSSDPFGEDPFARKGSDSSNPFSSPAAAGSKSKDVEVPEALAKPGPLTSNSERLRWAKRESEREEARRKKRQLEEEEAIAKAIRDSMNNS